LDVISLFFAKEREGKRVCGLSPPERSGAISLIAVEGVVVERRSKYITL